MCACVGVCVRVWLIPLQKVSERGKPGPLYGVEWLVSVHFWHSWGCFCRLCCIAAVFWKVESCRAAYLVWGGGGGEHDSTIQWYIRQNGSANRLGTVNYEIPLHISWVFISPAPFSSCRLLFSWTGFIATTSYIIKTRHKTKQWLSQHSICRINSHLGTLSIETERTGEKRQPKLSHFSTVKGKQDGGGVKTSIQKKKPWGWS